MNDDWIWWQANRNLDDSATAKYLGVSGEKLKRVYRCPADPLDSQKTGIGIKAGQGPYLYSYCMNDILGSNLVQGPQYGRSKLSNWRLPVARIVLT